jgi:hypothetical protein
VPILTLDRLRRECRCFQMFGVALAICGFAFGVHSVRAPAWLHFRHAHAIIGIITFILTISQFVLGLYVYYLVDFLCVVC